MFNRNIAVKEHYYQKEYDLFFKISSTETLTDYNGPSITAEELKIFDAIEPETLIDIGSSDGSRIFPELIKRNIKFAGLEKHKKLIAAASPEWRDKIYNIDITKPGVSYRDLGFTEPVEMVTSLCFAFGGIHSKKGRHTAFTNMAGFLCPGGLLVIDNLNYKGFKSLAKGVYYRISYDMPHQYFPSLKELNNLARANNMQLVRESVMINYDFNFVYLIFQKK